MRIQGKITRWNDERGFGFVMPDGGGGEVFLHVSAFRKRGIRPAFGDPVSYELGVDAKNRPQAKNVEQVENHFRAAPSAPPSLPKRRSTGSRWAPLLLLLCVVAGWIFLRPDPLSKPLGLPSIEPAIGARPQHVFSCEGKTRCSQMTSCEEATYYLHHCPGSLSDGDGDGIPCEDQWCGH